MYNLSYFREPDLEKVIAFMHAHPFVTLCGCNSKNAPVATQVPVLIRKDGEKIRLQGHFMRKTDHHLAFAENPQVLVLFTGPHEYVSASWYSNPVQASTWNYITVHARGEMKFLEAAALVDILRDTTTLFENNPHSPASFDNLPAEYVNRLVGAIVAFDIEVSSIDNVFKLSQNRDAASYRNIIEKLSEQSSDGKKIADEMRQRTEELYGGL